MKFIEELTPLNVIFLLLSVASIAISFYLYKIGKREKRPVYNVRSFNLLNNQATKVEGLEFVYKGRKIKNLTLTKVALWNQGKETINSNDVAPQDNIRIELRDKYEILDHELAYMTKQANNFRTVLSQDSKTILIEFDYFHYQEGMVISFYHTGLSSGDMQIKGTFKGVNEISKGVFKFGKYQDALGKMTVWKIRKPYRYLLFPIVFIPFIFAIMMDGVFRYHPETPKEFELND